ncbi:MAG: BolA family transcriptional regulator [Elusimicrobia bacterium]|nr:MAG: BolA family transcriptional regulator [Elusimicrobiota bacterium]
MEVQIGERLAALAPQRLELIDDSARHAGHEGARGGGRHIRLFIVSSAFSGQPPLARHRLVHQALADLLRSRIHALSIRAMTPEEAEAAPAS